MAIRRSDREELQSLIDEYGLTVILDEIIDIFDEMVQTSADEEALGILDRAQRKVIKTLKNQPLPRGRRSAAVAEDDDFDDDDDDDDCDDGDDD